MGDADVGDPLDDADGSLAFADKTVHIRPAAYGGATVILEGSNDGTNWATLRNTHDNSIISHTINEQVEGVLENPRFIRPATSGGTGTDITVIVVGRAILQLR